MDIVTNIYPGGQVPMLYERIQKMFAAVSLIISVLLIAGCKSGEDVSNQPVQSLDNVVHVFSGRYLLTTRGNVIISRDQLVHNRNDQEGSNDGEVSSFVKIDHLDNVVKVVSSENRNFALKENGQIWFWGEPLDYEQTGLFDISPQLKRPKKFPHADNVIDLWGSDDGIIFKKKDGTFWGWHASYCRVLTDLELVDPDFASDKVLPYPWLANAKDIGNCVTVLKQDGTVWESRDNALHPIIGLQDIVEIREEYPLDQNGKVWTWGAADQKPYPVMDHVLQVSGAFALKDDGSVWYLGNNSKLTAMKYIKEIGGNAVQVFALSKDGKVFVGDQNGNSHEIMP
ncbi:hypothetical protein ACFPPD_16040 [Cohnella suwonensis]|uniref:Uncharacterized protein n=1 Tax=Cohnella suwonensis TaxID=696072 RepID=A0ABW0LZ59_9BACL